MILKLDQVIGIYFSNWPLNPKLTLFKHHLVWQFQISEWVLLQMDIQIILSAHQKHIFQLLKFLRRLQNTNFINGFLVLPLICPKLFLLYQTQTQLFSKKIQVKEIRVYGEPWITDNSFRIDLIGSNGAVMTNGSQTFIAGTNLTIGNDFAWYNPGIAPTYALGLWIENLGTANFTINKIEIDYVAGGK